MSTRLDGERRAELERLRRRAYGPDADIYGDPAAIARLAELEDAVRRERSGGDAGHGPARLAADATDGLTPDSARAQRPGRRRSAIGVTVVVVAAAVAGAVFLTGELVRSVAGPTPAASTARSPGPSPVASVEGPTPFDFAYSPEAVPLVRVPLDGSFGDHVDLPAPDTIPPFPTEHDLQWAELLGEYFGWSLWNARSTAAEACLAETSGEEVRARCVGDSAFENGGVMVTVTFAELLADDRPATMTPDDGIGYWWAPGDAVLIVQGRAADAPAPQ